MTQVVRIALTETKNAYTDMPETIAELGTLAGRLDDVRKANLDHHGELIAKAADAGASLICLGELFSFPYFALGLGDPMWRAAAEDADAGPTVTACKALAKSHRIAIVAPIYEIDANTGKSFNTALVIDSSGELIGRYRKTHIPHGTNEHANYCETFYYQEGEGDERTWPKNVSKNVHFPVFDLGAFKFGVAICYDRHFTGVMRTLAGNGAEIVVVPSVTFGIKSRWAWDMEVCVDALRHNLFIGCSNRRGTETPWNQEFYGGSFFVSPNRRINALPVHENLCVADLDLGELRGIDPSGWNLARDRRPDIY